MVGLAQIVDLQDSTLLRRGSSANRKFTMSNRKSKSPTIEQIEAMMEEEQLPAPRSRRFVFWCITLLAVVLILILLAPTLLTQTSLRDYVIAKVVPPETAIVSMKSMNVGWFAPLKIEGLRVLDAQGLPLVEVAEVEGDRTLLDLAQDYTDIGDVVVKSPTVHLQLRPDGSNLEDTIAKLSGSDDSEEEPAATSGSSASIAAHLKVIDAKVIATELDTNSTWKIDQLNAEANLPKDQQADWQFAVQGNLNGQPFALSTSTPMGLATEAWPLGPNGTLTAKTNALPLAPIRYAALRAGQPIEQIDGLLTVDASANWVPDPGAAIPKFATTALVRTDGLLLAAKDFLGDDVLRVNQAVLQTKAQMVGELFNIQQCDMQSDFGHATLATTANITKLSDPNLMLDTLRRQQLNTSGQLDVAALTRALPNTLKIRDDVDVASGEVTWNVQSSAAPNAPAPIQNGLAAFPQTTGDVPNTRWTGSLETANVQVLRGGRPIEWKFPLEVQFAGTDGSELEVETFTARSDFFTLAAKGKLRSGSLQAHANLERLVYELNQVVDMSGIYVHGGLRSVVKWNEMQPNVVKLDATTKVAEFVMTQNERVLCREDELTTIVAATATLDGQNIAAINDGRLDVVSAGDFFIAELREAVADPTSSLATWPVVCRLKGNIKTWFARLKLFGLGEGWELAGNVDATTQVTANQRGIAVQTLVADIADLEALTEGIELREPVLKVETAGTIDLATYACRFPSTTVSSYTFALGANNIAVDMEPHFVMEGDIGYRANIARAMAYMPPTETATGTPPQKISGQASGRLQLRAQAETTMFDLTGSIDNLTVVQEGALAVDTQTPMPDTTLWEEPRLTTNASGSYNALADQLQLNSAQIIGKVLNLAAQGSAIQLSTQPVVDVAGEYGYDLDGLMALFGEYVGPDIRITGNQRQQFALRGPLFPAVASASKRVSEQLVARAGAGWDAANVYNTELGSAQINAQLANGVVQMSPLQLAVGEGRLQVAPTLDLNSQPLWMTLAPQVVADQIRITPEMTASWMKYVAPLIADATNAEGTFSVALEDAHIPLMEPTAGNIKGEFVVHGGALGPGPLATQFIDLASQIKRLIGQGESAVMDSKKTWVQLSPQQVGFTVADNRVHHEGFQMVIDGVPIRTNGYVSMVDDSIHVTAEVPIMDEWIEGTSSLAGLKGQTIRIPVSGTTSRPQLDRQALAGVSTQLARAAATGYLQDKLGGKLQQALGGKLGDKLGVPLNGGGSAASIDETIGGVQEKLNNKVQNEIGRQLNKLFK